MAKLASRLSLCCLFLSCAFYASSGPSIERVSYRGWIDSYRLTAGAHSLVIVPEIGGRIMEYSLDGRNVMWENPEEFGKTYEPAKIWRNYGGYKTWVSPQEAWNWPPDPLLDAGKANVEVFEGKDGRKRLRIIGCLSLETGIVFIKELSLSDSGEVTLIQRMRNVADRRLTWGIHDVTQVRTPCLVAFPVKSDSRFEGGFRHLFDNPKSRKQFGVRDGLCITRYLGEVGLIGSDSDGPWMIWFKDDLAYVKLFPPMKKGGDYGDKGSSVAVFTSDRKLGYVEMEILGPLVELSPGDEAELGERWRMYRLDRPVRSEYSIKRVAREMQGKGWIPPTD